MVNIYASIDIGTNTITILVVKFVDTEIKILYENEFITKLGDQLVETKNILNLFISILIKIKTVLLFFCHINCFGSCAFYNN